MDVQVSTLDLFKRLLEDQKSFPREQPYKDLVRLVNFLLRQFFKAVEEDSFLIVAVRALNLSPVLYVSQACL